MAITEIMNIADYGMHYQQMRIDAATINIANANVVQPTDGSGFKPLTVHLTGAFDSVLSSKSDVQMQALNVEDKRVFQPDHPAADTQGFVRYANVDMAREMVVLTEATRAYEANIKAFNAQLSMNSKALEIGK